MLCAGPFPGCRLPTWLSLNSGYIRSRSFCATHEVPHFGTAQTRSTCVQTASAHTFDFSRNSVPLWSLPLDVQSVSHTARILHIQLSFHYRNIKTPAGFPVAYPDKVLHYEVNRRLF
jgi:hypothetical protein